MKILLLILYLCLCQNSFADFNTGDVFGKGIIIQANGTTQTGGGRVLNFASGTTVTTVNNAYQITASGNSSGNVGIGTPNLVSEYVGVGTLGPTSSLYAVGNNVGVGTPSPTQSLQVVGSQEIDPGSTGGLNINATPSGQGGIDNNTVLVINGSGTNGQTTYTAETGQTVTFNNGSALSTTQFQFPPTSIYMGTSNGTHTRGSISVPDSASLRFFSSGSGNGTIEFLVYGPLLPSGGCDLWDEYTGAAGGTANNFFGGYAISGAGVFDVYDVVSNATTLHFTFPYTPSGSGSDQIRVSKSGTTWYGFVNGTGKTITYLTGSGSTTVTQPNQPWFFGGGDEAGGSLSYMQAIRMSNVARSTANFAIPTGLWTSAFSTPTITLSNSGSTGATIQQNNNTGAVSIINNSGNVGINSTVPGQLLDVAGTVRALGFVGNGSALTNIFPTGSAGTIFYNSSANTPATTNSLIINGSNIGIGSATPGQILDVSGTLRALNFSGAGTGLTGTANSLNIGGNSATTTALASSPANCSSNQAPTGINASGTAQNCTSYISSLSGALLATGSVVGATSQPQIFNGNVGIGTSLSANGLDVSSNVSIGTTYAGYKSASINGLAVQGNVGIGTWMPNGLEVEGQNVGIGTTLCSEGLCVMPSGSNNGNVGIGTWSDRNVKLYVNGALTATSQISGSSLVGSTFNTILANGYALGNLGVGTTTSSNYINKSATAGVITVGSSYAGIESSPWVSKAASGNHPVIASLATQGMRITNNAGSTIGIIANNYAENIGIGTAGIGNFLYYGDNSGPSAFYGNVGIGTYAIGNGALIVKGNVGIGSITPGQALDVQGTIRISMIGSTLSIPPGSNACKGQAILSSGTVTVSTTCTPTNSSDIWLTDATTGILTNVGSVTVGTVTAGTSFVINSTNALDASNVNWIVIKDN